RRVNLDPELHARLLRERGGPFVQVVVELLHADDGEAERARSLDLRLDRLLHLVARHQTVDAAREVDVRAEARRLEAVLLQQPLERLLELGVDAREAADALEA